MCCEELGCRFFVSFAPVPPVGSEEIVELFVSPYVVFVLVVRQASILAVATWMV